MLMQIPIKADLIRNIEANVPLELLNDNVWIAYYFKEQKNGKFTKPPQSNKGHSVDATEPSFSFGRACADGFPGIKLTPDNDYIAFDIDDELAKQGKHRFSKEILSYEFKEFLKKYPSYTEISPSGCGLRVIARCSDKKALLSKPGRLLLDPSKCIGGELFIHSGFVTVTGNCIENQRKLIDLNPIKILEWVKSSNTEQQEKPKEAMQPNVLRVLSLNSFYEILELCKLDQSEKVKEAYTAIMSDEYNHYDYWLKIMAASHDYATRVGKDDEIVNAVVDWSRTDKIAYQDDEDVLKHWDSFGSKENPMTYKTLLKFQRLLKFDWPKPIIKKGVNTGKPMVNENKNFRYLLDYYNIQFCLDIMSNNFYVKGDKSTMDQYFPVTTEKKKYFGMIGPYTRDEMQSKMWALAQDNGYDNVTSNTVGPLFKAAFFDLCENINIFEKWLNTEPDDIPFDLKEPGTDMSCSNLDYLISCIDFQPSQNMELAYKYLDTFFFEMVMPIYNVRQLFAERSFILILTGLENTRKTSFFKMLFPNQLLSTVMINPTEKLENEKSLRDFKNYITRNVLVVIDEFDHFYNPKEDSLFKSLVTCSSAPYTPIYKTDPVTLPRNGVLAGTTNESKLAYKQDSNRRFALLKVNYIDTDKMMKINWHYFYRYYVKEGSKAMMENKFPWKPTDDLIRLQYQENEKSRAMSNMEQMLLQLYDFEMTTHSEPIDYNTLTSVQTDNRLKSYRDIEGTLAQRFPKSKINIAELRRILERLCGRYTKTTNRSFELKCKGTISNGIIKQKKYTKYLMPPLLTDFNDE